MNINNSPTLPLNMEQNTVQFYIKHTAYGTSMNRAVSTSTKQAYDSRVATKIIALL